MKAWNNLSIGRKLIAGFLVIAAILAVIGAYGSVSMSNMQTRQDTIYNDALLPTQELGNAYSAVYTMRGDVYKAMLTPDQLAASEKAIAADVAEVNKQLASYRKSNLTPEEKDQLAKFDPAWATYQTAVADIVKSVKAGDTKAAMAAIAEGSAAVKARNEMGVYLDKLVELGTSRASKIVKDSGVEAGNSRLIFIVTAVVSALVALGLGLGIARSITRPLGMTISAIEGLGTDLKALASSLSAIGQGNLDSHFAVTAKTMDFHQEDEVGQLVKAYNAMLGQFELAGTSLGETVGTLRHLIAETKTLTRAATDGRLATRADASKYQGDYIQIVQGINDTLDAVIGPLNVAAEYVDRIGKGDIPSKIRDDYKGDFNELKTNLNACIDGLGGLAESNAVLQRIAVNDLTTQVTGKYLGVFAEVAQAVNEVGTRLHHIQDTVIHISNGDLSDLKNYQTVGRRSANDELVPSITRMIEAIQAMVSEAERLSTAAVAGQLATRADASTQQGAFREVVQGVNNTLDAVVGPLNVAAEYVERISRGEIPARITEAYHGDFAEIKDNLNAMLAYLTDMAKAAEQIAGGNLVASVTPRSADDVLGNAFVQMVDGLNGTLRQTNLVVHQVAQSVAQVQAVSQDFRHSAQSSLPVKTSSSSAWS